MHNEQFFEGLIRSLTPDQKAQIREHYNAADAKYITFHISVFNAGSVVTITFTDDPEEFDPETWNGYDVNISTSDTVTLLDKYGL